MRHCEFLRAEMAFVEYVPLTAFLQSLDTDVAAGTRNAFLSALGRKLVLAHIKRKRASYNHNCTHTP